MQLNTDPTLTLAWDGGIEGVWHHVAQALVYRIVAVERAREKL
jgi:hypothetical protein